MASQITISRFGLYPTDTPTGYCVGFTVTCNGYSSYLDTMVYLTDAENKTNEEIIEIAYNTVKLQVEGFINVSENKQALVGQSFTPSV